MEFKNYWGSSDKFQNDLNLTDNVYRIMREQCQYLYQNTKGEIFAVFGEIKVDNSIYSFAKTISDVVKGISGFTEIEETIAESSTKNLIDANAMYYDKRYGFEICTEKYRFRLFELRMTPIYPIEIYIDDGICKNVGSTLDRIAIPLEKSGHFQINNEERFCDVLQCILQDKKVRYIIGELQKRAQDNIKNAKGLPEKVIICEGPTDEIILHAIAQKLNQKVTFVVANGKYNVPAMFDSVNGKNLKSSILIVVDSDGNKEETEKAIAEKLETNSYELAVIDNCIEDWFMPEVADFSKLKLMQTIDTILEDLDFAELSKAHESFAKVIAFLQK